MTFRDADVVCSSAFPISNIISPCTVSARQTQAPTSDAAAGPPQIESQSPALEAFLLGQIDFDRALDLQQRLILQCRDRDDGQIILLLCEHPAIITVGRGGSPGEIAMQSGLVRNRQIEVRWVNRGGGCLVHCPGQLAIYPLVPLQWHGFSVGEFLDRFRAGIIETLDDLNVPGKGEMAPT